MHLRRTNRLSCVLIAFLLFCGPAFGITANKKAKKSKSAAPKATHFVATTHRPLGHLSKLPKTRIARGNWTSPTFADSTDGDSVDGEDLMVRRAAVQALGPFNGTVVVVDPTTGRLLSIVNQKLAFQSGFQPCSTIKIVAALAGLSEGVLDQSTVLKVGRRKTMGLTDAIAHSNNSFFSMIGYRLGYDKVVHYASLFGLGEKAGLNLDGEQPGTIAAEAPKDGVGMMTSFGEGFFMTPLELAGLMTVVANGGTLYYLQHPRTPEEISQFTPRVKRQLEVQEWLPVIKPGMMGAVEYGTARRAVFNPDEPIFGKTGTCTDGRTPTHLGWFGSYNELGSNKLVVVVLLTGGGRVNGPVASGVAGAVYRNLSQQNYFAQTQQLSPASLVSTQSCCLK